MGLFGRTRRPSASRIAEGGPELSSSRANGTNGPSSTSGSSAAAAKSQKPKKTEDPLDLFGAGSDDSDDDATIDRYANGDDEALDEQQALEAEGKKVSTLLSKVSCWT